MRKIGKLTINLIRLSIFVYSLYVAYQLIRTAYFIVFPQNTREIFDDCQTQIGQYTESCLASIRTNHIFMALAFVVVIVILLFVAIKGIPLLKKSLRLS